MNAKGKTLIPTFANFKVFNLNCAWYYELIESTMMLTRSQIKNRSW